MSRDDESAEDAPDAFQPDDWISARETIRRFGSATHASNAHHAIATNAHVGRLRAHAELLIFGEHRRENVEVPIEFWWAGGNDALIQDWDLGFFETWINQRMHVRAFGVQFYRAEVERLTSIASTPKTERRDKEPGGRPMSDLWPEWVAELALLVHEVGHLDNCTVDNLIGQVADRLAHRGLDGPSRTTLQETARAVIRRMKAAGN